MKHDSQELLQGGLRGKRAKGPFLAPQSINSANSGHCKRQVDLQGVEYLPKVAPPHHPKNRPVHLACAPVSKLPLYCGFAQRAATWLKEKRVADHHVTPIGFPFLACL